MELLTDDQWNALLSSAEHDLAHLEMRDVYAVEDEKPRFDRWLAGRGTTAAEDTRWWQSWTDMIRDLTRSGVVVRRARIVSEPVTAYIRYEWEQSRYGVAAGERLRWLPRSEASLITLPGNDFWLIDGRTVVFNHFTGDGAWLGNEVVTSSDVALLCAAAFEAVWRAATPHEKYAPGRG